MYTKEQVAQTIDHAVLKPEQTLADLKANAEMCINNKVFSMCVKPCDIKPAKELLKDSGVKVSCVLSFPHGADATPTKAFQAKQAIEDGTDEVSGEDLRKGRQGRAREARAAGAGRLQGQAPGAGELL